MNIWQTIEDMVVNREGLRGLFNPYSDTHPEWDLPDAASIRVDNFKKYVDDHSGDIDILLVAEAPGPWGCRFSGVPVTSEAQLLDKNFPGTGCRTTHRTEPFSEYSASIFWRVLTPFYGNIFTWNTVPMHPYHPGKPDSIRAPRQSEINLFLPVLEEIVLWANPRRILAIGRKAENALERVGAGAQYVRHPSQGGSKLFQTGVLRVVEELRLRPVLNQNTAAKAVI